MLLFGLVGCNMGGDGDGDGYSDSKKGLLSFGNVPTGYSLNYIEVSSTPVYGWTIGYGGNYQAVGASSSGNVFTLIGWNGTMVTTSWTGSGSLPVLLLNSGGSISNAGNPIYSYTTINASDELGLSLATDPSHTTFITLVKDTP